MSRRHAAEKREILPDVKFGDVVVAKFINNLTVCGKKSLAESILYNAFDRIESHYKANALEVFKEAIKNVRPSVEVRSKRVGGATYQVPMDVRETRSLALAIRWIITAAKKRSERVMALKLAAELMDGSNNRGVAVKKREDGQKMADANRAFSHFRW
jgi:small subunit ribosomal protein S7